jgi:hypothetical protein
MAGDKKAGDKKAGNEKKVVAVFFELKPTSGYV